MPTTNEHLLQSWASGASQRMGLLLSDILTENYWSHPEKARCKVLAKQIGSPVTERSLQKMLQNNASTLQFFFRFCDACRAKTQLEDVPPQEWGAFLDKLKRLRHGLHAIDEPTGMRLLTIPLDEALMDARQSVASAASLTIIALNGDFFRCVRLALMQRRDVTLPTNIETSETQRVMEKRIDSELAGEEPFTNLNRITVFLPTESQYRAWLMITDRLGRYEEWRASNRFWVNWLRKMRRVIRKANRSIDRDPVALYECPLLTDISYFIDGSDGQRLILGSHLLYGVSPSNRPTYEVRNTGDGWAQYHVLNDARENLKRDAWKQKL